jgi:hypothetical protein
MNMKNKKKEYVSPEMEILTLSHLTNLLCESGEECDEFLWAPPPKDITHV